MYIAAAHWQVGPPLALTTRNVVEKAAFIGETKSSTHWQSQPICNQVCSAKTVTFMQAAANAGGSIIDGLCSLCSVSISTQASSLKSTL
jgi:hypothetical protein